MNKYFLIFFIFVFISNKFSSQELEETFDDDVIDFAIPGEAGLSEEERLSINQAACARN